MFQELIKSLDNLGKVKHYFDVHLVAQDPWGEQEALGAGATHVSMCGFSKNPSMLNLRMKSVQEFGTEYNYIMFVDDDLLYEEGAEEYFSTVIRILKADEPAVFSLFGSRYDRIPQYNRDNCIMTTNRGLIIAAELLEGAEFPYMVGPCEDAILGYHALNKDYNHVLMGGAPVGRREVKHIAPDAVSSIHNLASYEANARMYIRAKHDDPYWEVLTGKFPKGVRNGTT